MFKVGVIGRQRGRQLVALRIRIPVEWVEIPNAVMRQGKNLWVAPHVWRRRLVFWGGGLTAGFVAVLFACGLPGRAG